MDTLVSYFSALTTNNTSATLTGRQRAAIQTNILHHHGRGTKTAGPLCYTNESTLRVVFTGDGRHTWDGSWDPVEKIINTSQLSKEEGRDVIKQLSKEGKLDFRRVAKYPLVDEYMTQMEQEILLDEPVKDLMTVASPATSHLELAGLTQKRTVQVGVKLTVRVVLKDSKGRPVLKGGHDVRVWMTSKFNRAATVHVTDLRNGTYMASLPVLWPGQIEIQAALQGPREFRRVVLSLMSTMKMLQQIIGSFVSSKNEEATLCSFIPVIPGYKEVCNLTSLNSGLPWYCGHPLNPGLQCRDWASSSSTYKPQHWPVSDAENALIRQLDGEKCVKKLPKPISLTVVPDPQKTPGVNATCRPLKPRDTWEDHSPTGYWENNTWRPLAGCPLPQLTSSGISQCLRDTHFIFIGDSNGRKVVSKVAGVIQTCRRLPDPKRSDHPNMVHVPLSYHCPQNNVHLSWYPHALPFFSGPNIWSDSRVKYAPSHILDRLLPIGKYVVLIHLYAHFSRVHTYLYVQHVRDTARAVRDLLQRSPNVPVLIRGPHVTANKPLHSSSDFGIELALRVLRQEFQDLRDRVVLLNFWDMTVANENCDVHPNQYVVTAVCQMIFSHLCYKQT